MLPLFFRVHNFNDSYRQRAIFLIFLATYILYEKRRLQYYSLKNYVDENFYAEKFRSCFEFFLKFFGIKFFALKAIIMKS